MVQKTLIVFTGESNAGKSTLANMLAKNHSLPIFAVGDFERGYAKNQGYENVVRFEQEMGLDKAYYSLTETMLKSIERLRNEKGIVIEGVYDPILYSRITNMFVDKVHLVNVTAPMELRILRGAKKDKTNLEEAQTNLLQLEIQKDLVGRLELIRRADITIVNDSTIENAYEKLETNIKGLAR